MGFLDIGFNLFNITGRTFYYVYDIVASVPSSGRRSRRQRRRANRRDRGFWNSILITLGLASRRVPRVEASQNNTVNEVANNSTPSANADDSQSPERLAMLEEELGRLRAEIAQMMNNVQEAAAAAEDSMEVDDSQDVAFENLMTEIVNNSSLEVPQSRSMQFRRKTPAPQNFVPLSATTTPALTPAMPAAVVQSRPPTVETPLLCVAAPPPPPPPPVATLQRTENSANTHRTRHQRAETAPNQMQRQLSLADLIRQNNGVSGLRPVRERSQQQQPARAASIPDMIMESRNRVLKPVQKSPGGTPVRNNSNAPVMPQDFIAAALKKKFKSLSTFTPSPDRENEVDWEDTPATPIVSQNL